jgi:hypothetical protein
MLRIVRAGGLGSSLRRSSGAYAGSVSPNGALSCAWRRADEAEEGRLCAAAPSSSSLSPSPLYAAGSLSANGGRDAAADEDGRRGCPLASEEWNAGSVSANGALVCAARWVMGGVITNKKGRTLGEEHNTLLMSTDNPVVIERASERGRIVLSEQERQIFQTLDAVAAAISVSPGVQGWLHLPSTPPLG